MWTICYIWFIGNKPLDQGGLPDKNHFCNDNSLLHVHQQTPNNNYTRNVYVYEQVNNRWYYIDMINALDCEQHTTIGGTVFFPMVVDEMELNKLQMDLIGIELVYQSYFSKLKRSCLSNSVCNLLLSL